MTAPSNYNPTSPAMLVGPAALLCRVQIAKIARLAAGDRYRPQLFYGPPGTGKTGITKILAAALTASPHSVMEVSARNMTIDTVRQWQHDNHYRDLYGDRSVRIINEVDLMPTEARDLILQLFDDLPVHKVVLCTSNQDIDKLPERLQGRFITHHVAAPTADELGTFIARTWEIPEDVAFSIARANNGCVRTALYDTENWLDHNAVTA